jgi:probable phosphomutase (TIGR03848 family)
MATVYLVRHGRSMANSQGVLAGRRRGVDLDSQGERQAIRAGALLKGIAIAKIVTSPLLRTRNTAKHVQAQHPNAPKITSDDRFVECDYGDWTGQSLKSLASEPLWTTVQHHPSAVTFPGGESMVAMQRRAVDGIKDLNARFDSYVVVSHGDVIKAVLADALGMHLDQFQRIIIDPGSISIVTYTPGRPMVSGVNVTRSLRGVAAASGQADVGGRSR